MVDQVVRAVRSVPPRTLDHRLRELQQVNVVRSLPDIQVPVLYLAASRDRLVGRRSLEQIRSGVANLTVETLESPHFLLQTRPQEAAEVITRFLQERSPARPQDS